MLGALFLRSYNRGERVYVAMVSRGYEGAIRLERGEPFRAADALFLGAVFAAVAAIRVSAWAWSA
jgi:cobalt/nickel transport system permease protein